MEQLQREKLYDEALTVQFNLRESGIILYWTYFRQLEFGHAPRTVLL